MNLIIGGNKQNISFKLTSSVPLSPSVAEIMDGSMHSVHTPLIEEHHSRYTAPEATRLRFNDWIVDEAWSCATIFITFWFFVCLIMIMGVYGSVTLILGPHSSVLIRPNSCFVNYVKIENLYEEPAGPIMLYGLRREPPLDVVVNWCDAHDVSLESSAHKEWTYFLNKGSQINISYSSSSNLILLIAKGYDGLNQWIEKPFCPNTSLSWQIIQGNGTIQQDIHASSSYYVALGNFGRGAVGVHLSIRLRTLVYNKTEAYDKCSFTRGECTLQLPFGGRNAALLTSPGPIPGRAVSQWYLKLSYGPRWITYLGGIGGMTFLFLAAIHFSCYSFCLFGARRLHIHNTEGEAAAAAAAPLLQDKDDDFSSRGSSYDSVSHDDEDVEDPDGKDGGENNSTNRRLCAICFDAPRDCFFLPCGHCVACFTCGTRISQASGTCPICRRHMKKVKKIFTV